MLRFLPDGWLEGLLRPLAMGDPTNGIYFEQAAPDWRFIALLLVALAVLIRRPGGLPRGALPLLLALAAVFYLWTFRIGNGRYFIAGLLLVGPLLVMMTGRLPGRPVLRWGALALLALLQTVLLHQEYTRNQWGMLRWAERGGIGLSPAAVRERPAIFVTISGISLSMLVPHFHPQARWTNVVGQRDVSPSMQEYPRLLEMLRGPLPLYLVASTFTDPRRPDQQPSAEWRQSVDGALAIFGLSLTGADCALLHTRWQRNTAVGSQEDVTRLTLPVCPLQYSDAARLATLEQTAKLRRGPLAEAFDRVEQACPRFFPHADGVARVLREGQVRFYPSADTRLITDGRGTVGFKYFRAANPTWLGTIDDVRAGRFTLACDKLPGRYRLPWLRDD